MANGWPYRETKSLLMEYVATHQAGNFTNAVNGVLELAHHKGLVVLKGYQAGQINVDYTRFLSRQDRENVTELIRQLFWDLLLNRIIVFGQNEDNPNFPNYRVTGHGEVVLRDHNPQPYDPDGFLQHFRRVNPAVDPVIVEYVEEAIRAFNATCLKSSLVMIGGASEKALLLLHDTFENAITDANKKTAFQRATGLTISRKFQTLKNRLDLMVGARKFTRELNDIINIDLPGAFELIRRLRNAAGHPELFAGADPDGVFLNLRILPEYIRKLYLLIIFFNTNPADW